MKVPEGNSNLGPEQRSQRLYRGLLGIYPPAFRRSFGRGMIFTFLEQWQEARARGVLSLASFWLRSLICAVLFGVEERARAYSERLTNKERKGSGKGETLMAARQEFLLTLRRFKRTPTFALVAVSTLALGIGGVTAIYSLVQSVLLNPLTYPESDRLVRIWHSALGAEIPELEISNGTYLHYRNRSRALDGIALYRIVSETLTGEAEPQQVVGASVTHGFFDLMMGPRPELGRFFQQEEDQPGASPVALISHRLWHGRFGADPEILGRLIQVDGVSHEVIGVLPVEFGFPNTETDLWVPMRLDLASVILGRFNAYGIARLKQGVGIPEAESELRDLVASLKEPYPGGSYQLIVEQGRLTARLTPLKEQLVGPVRSLLWILLGSMSFVLLVACANVANLFLVRIEGRSREMAVRNALGASPARILRHSLIESLVLSGLAGALGYLLALASIAWLLRSGPLALPRINEIEVGVPGTLCALLLSLCAGLALGSLHKIRIGGDDARDSLRTMGRTQGQNRQLGRQALVVSQVALALVLLVGAGLMWRSFLELKAVRPGFSAEGNLVFSLSLPANHYPDRNSILLFHRQLLERLSGMPGVQAAGASTCLPLSSCSSMNPVTREGMVLAEDETPPAAQLRLAYPRFFPAMGISILSGRDFEWADVDRESRLAIVSRAFAERFYVGESPLGKRIYPSVGKDLNWFTIVGVAEDVPETSLMDRPLETAYFLDPGEARSMAFALKAQEAPLSLAKPIQEVIWKLDPDLPVSGLREVRTILDRALGPTRFAMTLLGIGAAVSTLLGLIGVYGTLSYSVSQRRGEIGVRLALGAEGAQIRRMVLRQGALLALLGALLGLGAALLTTRLMQAILFQIEPLDPETFSTAIGFLLLLVLGACLLPAQRASRQDPVEVLKSE